MTTALDDACEDARYWHEQALEYKAQLEKAQAENRALKEQKARLWRRIEADETALVDMLGGKR